MAASTGELHAAAVRFAPGSGICLRVQARVAHVLCFNVGAWPTGADGLESHPEVWRGKGARAGRLRPSRASADPQPPQTENRQDWGATGRRANPSRSRMIWHRRKPAAKWSAHLVGRPSASATVTATTAPISKSTACSALLGQARAPVLHPADARLRVVRVHPLAVGDRVLPSPAPAAPLSRRGLGTLFGGHQPPQVPVVALARVAPHNVPGSTPETAAG